MLVEQAARNKAKNPAARVFVYRNIVKALPWYLEVSQLLMDQQYWGYFIPYADCRTAAGEYVCQNNVTGAVDAGANLYHDHEQTPGWTGGELRETGNGGPDGVCRGDLVGNSNKGCDCGGPGVPCGACAHRQPHRASVHACEGKATRTLEAEEAFVAALAQVSTFGTTATRA